MGQPRTSWQPNHRYHVSRKSEIRLQVLRTGGRTKRAVSTPTTILWTKQYKFEQICVVTSSSASSLF